nr:hypothetical protein [Tanacetum cinerariifolium]
MKEKGDECIFVGVFYSVESLQSLQQKNQSDHGIYSCQFRRIATNGKSALVQISSDPSPKCQTMALEHNSLSPGGNCQENASHGDKTGTTSNALDLLFSPMFDELFNGSSEVVSKSSAVSAADAPNQRQ